MCWGVSCFGTISWFSCCFVVLFVVFGSASLGLVVIVFVGGLLCVTCCGAVGVVVWGVLYCVVYYGFWLIVL